MGVEEEVKDNEQPQFIVTVDDEKPISLVEQEKQFIKEEEEKIQQPINKEAETVIETKSETEIQEENVLSFLKSKYNKEVTSIDELFKEPEVRVKSEEIPFEDVKAFLEYKKKTGRGLDDFIKLSRDLDKEDPSKLLSDFYREVEDMDSDDIRFQMKQFEIDEDLMTDDEISQKRLAYKKELKKAKKHFEGLKEQFKVPLESRDTFVPEEEREAYKAFKTRAEVDSKDNEIAAKRSEVFLDKTNKLFDESFDGFKFPIDENTKVSFKPAEANVLKQQSNLKNFIERFLDNEGFLKGDGTEFHKAIAMASDPDKAAKFFYEKGVADSIERMEAESKNIDLRQQVKTDAPSGVQVSFLDEDRSSFGFKYRKKV